jgi:hypothetical protein
VTRWLGPNASQQENSPLRRNRELQIRFIPYDAPAERDLLGYEDARHSAAAQLALDAVLAAEQVVEAIAKVGCGRQRLLPAGVGVGGRYVR